MGDPQQACRCPELVSTDERRVVEFGAEELFATTVARLRQLRLAS